VLRYHQDMSETQVADLLGISVGAVKSQAARGPAALREQAALGGYRPPTQTNTATGGE
jgi:DNA-directed RNA polymerase specialized sigma24 family protein